MPTIPKSSARFCEVCNHPDRMEIERLLFTVSPGNPRLTIDGIADAFGVSSNSLRVHAMMHMPLVMDFSQESEEALVAGFRSRSGAASHPVDSATSSPSEPSASAGRGDRKVMADAIDMREGDMLLASATEYLTTLTTLGRRLKRYASDNSDEGDQRLAAFCSPSMVNLYVNAGAELRKAIQAINELNTSVNGSHDSAAAGLAALAAAIANSGPAVAQAEGPQFLDMDCPQVEVAEDD